MLGEESLIFVVPKSHWGEELLKSILYINNVLNLRKKVTPIVVLRYNAN